MKRRFVNDELINELLIAYKYSIHRLGCKGNELTSPTAPLRSSAKTSTASCQPWKDAEMPGCWGAPWTLVIRSRRVSTLECSLQLSTTSLSSREGLGGNLGAQLPTLGKDVDPESLERPGWCRAKAASALFRSFSIARSCKWASSSRRWREAGEPGGGGNDEGRGE